MSSIRRSADALFTHESRFRRDNGSVDPSKASSITPVARPARRSVGTLACAARLPVEMRPQRPFANRKVIVSLMGTVDDASARLGVGGNGSEAKGKTNLNEQILTRRRAPNRLPSMPRVVDRAMRQAIQFRERRGAGTAEGSFVRFNQVGIRLPSLTRRTQSPD